MYLVADSLVVDEHAVFDQVPFFGRYPFVVVPYLAERVGLGFVGYDVDQRTSVLLSLLHI